MLETTFNNQLDSSIRHQLAKHYYNEVFQSQPTDNYPLRVKDEEVLVAQKKIVGNEETIVIYSPNPLSQSEFSAVYQDGWLTFGLFSKEKKDLKNIRHPFLWAADFLETAVNYYQKNNQLLGIRTYWSEGDNFEAFWSYLEEIYKNKQTVNYTDIEIAAKASWTGRQAIKLGFSNIDYFNPTLDEINQLLLQNKRVIVQVIFAAD